MQLTIGEEGGAILCSVLFAVAVAITPVSLLDPGGAAGRGKMKVVVLTFLLLWLYCCPPLAIASVPPGLLQCYSK